MAESFHQALHANHDPDGLLNHFSSAADTAAILRSWPKTDATPEPLIPKIIHQIWLGSPVPRHLAELSDGWKRHHPDWEFKLWDDRALGQLRFDNRDLFDSIDCWGAKSDILRAELVFKQGGFYVDFDYRSYRPIDEVRNFDFIATSRWVLAAHLGWPALYPSPLIVCNSFFGARPGHPVLQRFLESVRSTMAFAPDFDKYMGALPLPAILAMGGKPKVKRILRTSLYTYLPFHREVIRELQKAGTGAAVLPPAFFNPVMQDEKQLKFMPHFWKLKFDRKAPKFRLGNYSGVKPYSFAEHLSKQSWL